MNRRKTAPSAPPLADRHSLRASSCGGRRSRPSWCATRRGELEVKEQKLKLIKDRYPILGVPFIRGVVNFLASLVEGVRGPHVVGGVLS